jgi:hypothetical protein
MANFCHNICYRVTFYYDIDVCRVITNGCACDVQYSRPRLHNIVVWGDEKASKKLWVLIASVLARAGTRETVSVMKATMAIARHPPIKVILVAVVQAAVDMAAAVIAAAATAVAEVALVPRAVAPAAPQCRLKSSVLARES